MLPGGSLVDPWWILGGSLQIVVVGRDPWDTQKTSGFTLRFAFGPCANGPMPPTYPPHAPTYGFMVQFVTAGTILIEFR